LVTPPIFNAKVGVPQVKSTLTTSEKLTEISIKSPTTLYVAVGEVTLSTTGAIASIMILLLNPSECSAPGTGNVKLTSLSKASRIVAPFKSNALIPV